MGSCITRKQEFEFEIERALAESKWTKQVDQKSSLCLSHASKGIGEILHSKQMHEVQLAIQVPLAVGDRYCGIKKTRKPRKIKY